MSQINVSKWGKFKLPDININSFSTSTLHLRQVEAASGIVPKSESINYVTRGKFNNGVKMRVVKEPDFKPSPKNTISFGGETGEFFYQTEPYVTGRDVYYIDTSKLTENEALFLLTVIKKRVHSRSTFTTIMTANIIDKIPFQLPTDSDGKPDWQFMNKFIENKKKIACHKISILNKIG